MDFDWIWKGILIVIAGTILLRMAGRKSISQMTLPETVIMVGIGTLLIQPIASKNVWVTFLIGVLLVLTLMAIEYLELKVDFFENIISGKAKVLIENGTIHEANLKKVRLTADQLEANLRQKNVSKLTDVEFATLEPNGQVGLMLKKDAQPVTKKEFQQLMDMMQQTATMNNQMQALIEQIAQLKTELQSTKQEKNLFTEINEKSEEAHEPRNLQ